ncbi:MAG: OB-fold domain-containing protein [Flavobacteriales bacterium]|nr:OB-fold domain-containing protein [Flavobacteriales bacterium]
MSFIKEYKVAIPKFRITDKVLHPRLGRKGQHAICYTDEDIITLAFQAASQLNLATRNSEIDAVLFATTSPVFKNRYHASFVADLLGLNQGILCLDFGTSARAGTDALIMADKLVHSSGFKNVLLIASEVYYPKIGNETRAAFGHAAVAMVVSNEKGIAEITNTKSFSSALAEEFKYKGSSIQYDARFARTEGFKNNLGLALNESDFRAKEVAHVILHSPYAKLAFGQLIKAGFDLEAQLRKDDVEPSIGNTGACHALVLMINAIENGKGNVLIFDYLNGTNVISLSTKEKSTSNIQHSKSTIGHPISEIESYQDYLQLRKQGKFTSKGYTSVEIFSSEMISEREKNSLVHLHGYECAKCGTVYFVKAVRCNSCHHEELNQKQLQKTGVVYSVTSEYYFPNSFAPTNMVIIDLDGGGRMTVQQTDDMFPTEDNTLRIGDKVSLVYRKMMENDNKPNYFWKCVKNERR